MFCFRAFFVLKEDAQFEIEFCPAFKNCLTEILNSVFPLNLLVSLNFHALVIICFQKIVAEK